MERQGVVVLVAAALLRLALFLLFPALPTLLQTRVEVSTPVTSYKRLLEGLFLYSHNVSPYDGGVFHQAPLFLAFFTSLPSSPLVVNTVYILADLSSAISLYSIASTGVSSASSPRKNDVLPPWAVAAAYLFNPFGIATCLSRSTAVFTNTVLLLSIYKASVGNAIPAMLAAAMSSYLSLYPALIVPPLILLAYDQSTAKGQAYKRTLAAFAAKQVMVFAAALVGLLVLSFTVTGNWEFLRSTYGVHLLLPDLTPNVGLWWYFFVEMFDSFRAFFLCVFQLHLVIYVGGLCIRFRTRPLFVLTTLLGITAIFKSYPSISDAALYLSLLSLYNHIFPLMRYTFFATSTLLYATLLGPAFYHLWIYAGSGNANFFYAITLVWCLALTSIVTDAVFAVLRDEWDREHPDRKGMDVVQV